MTAWLINGRDHSIEDAFSAVRATGRNPCEAVESGNASQDNLNDQLREGFHSDINSHKGGGEMTAAYIVRANSEDCPDGIYASLKDGKARLGWSYSDDLDLRKVRLKIDQHEVLSEEERVAWRGKGFLEYVQLGDYLLYANQPKDGQFCIVQVLQEGGEYDYGPEQDSVSGDFRSYRRCQLLCPPIDKIDAVVPPIIRSRLGLQGRFFCLYDMKELEVLLSRLKEVGKQEIGADARFERIIRELHKHVPKLVHHEFPQHDLSRKFCKELFGRIGYPFEIQEGSGEKGSDIVVSISNPLLSDEFRVGIQVFSYTGPVSTSEVKRKLAQLLEGWEDNALDYGVLLTTGELSREDRKGLEEHNRANPTRKVKAIDGEQFADLFLQNFNTIPHFENALDCKTM